MNREERKAAIDKYLVEDTIGPGGRLLLEGSYIYINDPEGSNYTLKQYPDGRRELVDRDKDGKQFVVKELPAVDLHISKETGVEFISRQD